MRSRSRIRFRTAVGVVSIVVGGTVAVASTGAQAAPPPKPVTVASADQVSALAGGLAKRLGDRSPGSYFDKATGKFVVTVTDSATAELVRSAGAVPRRVSRSLAQLNNATAALDRSARIPGTAWRVDPASNQVLVTADSSVKGAKLAKLKSVMSGLGSAVRLRQVAGAIDTTATVMKNGTAIYGSGNYRCSLGFSIQPQGNTDPNNHYFLTAGHCAGARSTWFADSGNTSLLGSNAGSFFGAQGDYGFVHYEGVGIRVLSQINGRSNVITRTDDPYIGEGVARSGSTTGVHSGTVTGLNVTMTYQTSHVTVKGLIETNICAEGGDSGGPLYALDKGLGITSGALGNCLGGTQISWYQPIAPLMVGYFMEIWP
jgi:streptogrisin D